MKKLSTLLVSALVPLFAAAMVQSCAGGESAMSGGSGGDNNGSSGGSSGNASGGSNGNGSGGKTSSGGSTANSGGSPGSGGRTTGSGGSVSSGGSTGSGGRTTGSGGAVSSGGTTGTSSGGTTGAGSGGTTGGACTPTDATMSVMNGFATSGTWMGYAYTYMGSAPSSVTPVCGTTGTCFMTAMKQLCVSGSVGPDVMYNASAGFGWNIGGMLNMSAAVAVAPGGTGLAYNVPGLTTQMRFQLEDGAGVQYCANITAVPSGTIPWGMFAEKCYNTPTGAVYKPSTAIKSVGIVVPSDSGTARAFCFCVSSLGPA